MTAGAVLCGGASRRMGTDKALVEVDGVPMAERVAQALEGAGCDPVVFVGGDAALLARFGRPTVADEWPGEGPLGGVVTAMRSLAVDVVVAACDLPFLHVDAVQAVLAAVGDQRRVDVAVATTGRVEPMLAWWGRHALGPLLRQWDDGVRALHEAIGVLVSLHVHVDPAAMRNVNTVADLSCAETPDR